MMNAIAHQRGNAGQRERLRIRSGAFTGPTAGLAPGHVQANLVILPRDLAHDFLRFAQANPKPCPLLAVSEAGDPDSRPSARTWISAPICRATGSGGTGNWCRNRSMSAMSGATTWSASPSAARSPSRKR